MLLNASASTPTQGSGLLQLTLTSRTSRPLYEAQGMSALQGSPKQLDFEATANRTP